MDCLLLRLDAPLMSFGGVVVDQINPVERFIGCSQVAGMLANALGLDHAHTEAIGELQQRLRVASRWDAEPEHIVDYQTVDLGQDFLTDTGWTTRGTREDRGGGAATSGTHQRYRHYWANGCATVAVALEGPGSQSLTDIECAIQRPARPLFIGRKVCLPSTPMLLGRRQAISLKEALASEPLADIAPRRRPASILACWPINNETELQSIDLHDIRDWGSNMHLGRQRYAVGFLEGLK